MDPITITVIGSVLGNVAHICKKGMFHDSDSFVQVVERWVFSKPFHSLAAVVMGVVAAGTLSVAEGASWVKVFSDGFLVGYLSDSLVNRAEKI